MSNRDLAPTISLLARASNAVLESNAQAAILHLQRLHRNSMLPPVDGWPDSAGDIYDCYMDILGLNGRPIRPRFRSRE
jgi:hypothetical protein